MVFCQAFAGSGQRCASLPLIFSRACRRTFFLNSSAEHHKTWGPSAFGFGRNSLGVGSFGSLNICCVNKLIESGASEEKTNALWVLLMNRVCLQIVRSVVLCVVLRAGFVRNSRCCSCPVALACIYRTYICKVCSQFGSQPK